MSLIKALNEDTISQISAGEVVERPSHLIKELVENSLDAGATEIEIDFDQGGRFVRVKDNGTGIAPNQMSLALARHTTSKIQKIDDIWKLNTYGFRGEALASIASVSDLTLISGQKGEDSYKLRQVFGKEEESVSIGESKGTKVIIRSLFENTPARFKFLKSEGTENSSIKTTLKALALSQEKISFRVLQKSKLLYYWPAQKNLLQRTAQVLGKKDLYFTEETKGAYKIQAVIAPPHHTLKNRKSSWFFVSDRWIESRVLQAGLMSAYRGLLMHGEYPLAVIKITGPNDEIDVNVHPTKSQVRFKDSSFIFKLVESPIRRLLETAPWTKKIISASSLKKEENLNFSNYEFKKTNWPNKKQEYSTKTLSQLAWDKESKNLEPKEESFKSIDYKIKSEQDQKISWAHLQILAQAHLTYIVCQSDHSLIFIDQHASHERIIYERMFQSWKKGNVEVQNQLVPFVLDLEEGQTSALLELNDDLKKLGVQLESLSPYSLTINSYPPIIKEKALQEGLLFLAKRRLETGDRFSFERVVSDLCATLACHSAIRAGKSLNLEQMRELLKQMDEYPLSSFCPHGRPVFVEYPISRLEKDFGRIV
ncbi:MAG: DNA mismatch repair endonuclease MutL [Bdellovibrionaceae bacterium]|nr:DNA mismatch repair endonuclease MutL [Pseudobdellovibrionaceae bacterium]